MDQVKEKPTQMLLKMQQEAEAVVKGIKHNHDDGEAILNSFLSNEKCVLIVNYSLLIKAYYPHNSAAYTITGFEVIAVPWTNNQRNKAIDCKVKLRLNLLFKTIRTDLVWQTSMYAISTISDSLTIVNKENSEKNLRIENLEKFEEFKKAIRSAFKELGLAYQIDLV